MSGVVFCTVGCDNGISGGGGGGGAQCATSLIPTLARHTGTGSVVVAAPVRSVTLTVIGGDVDVTIGANPPVRVPAGWTQTWSGDNCGDNLGLGFTFAGVDAMSDFTVATVDE